MTKNILCSVCVIVLALSFCVPVFASFPATAVTCPADEPITGIFDNGDGTYSLKIACVSQKNDSTETLYRYVSILLDSMPSSVQLEWSGTTYIKSPAVYIPDSCNILNVGVHFNEYLVSDNSWIRSINTSLYSVTGYHKILISATTYWGWQSRYFIFDHSYTYYDSVTSEIISEPFVSWNELPPTQYIFRSHLPEPQSDEYNKYFVMISEDDSRLYWFSVRDLSYTILPSSETDTPYIEGLFANLCLLFDSDDSIKLMIDYNRELLDLPPSTDIFTEYEILASCYDLENGELINSTLLSNNVTSSIDVNVGLTGDFWVTDPISVYSYGLAYNNISSIIVHLADIIWGVDPVIESWRENTTSILNQILQALQGESAEVTTVSTPDFFGQIEDAQGQLTITNADGETPHGGGGRDFFDSADDGIENIATPLSFVRDFYETYIQDEPILYLPLIVALALGVAITILGKDKSD